jgi:hypothetical protein
MENGRRVAEVFQQLPHANRTHVLDHVQRNERFPGLHGLLNTGFSFCQQAEIECTH